MSEVPIFVYEKCGSEVRSGQGVSNKEVASMQGAQYSDYSGVVFRGFCPLQRHPIFLLTPSNVAKWNPDRRLNAAAVARHLLDGEEAHEPLLT